jgi:hypothetical protein
MRVGLALLLFESCLPSLRAGSDVALRSSASLRDDNSFAKGACEVQALSGAFFNVDAVRRARPNIDYALQALRVGVMLTGTHGPGLLSGNTEFLAEVFGGDVFNGPSGALGGATLILRYNFRQPHASIVPYFQVGVGGLYNDVYRNRTQSSIGSVLEFNLQGSLGVRYLVNPRWSILAECGYRHISNGGLAEHNLGLDTVGCALGVGLQLY